VYGPAGCGKTTWIISHIKQTGKKMYHWNARTDRTLREGREALHIQVRSQEPLFVWIEGTDDLTPEAQAFLRRILETVSQNVQCILECRDPYRITPAIQSRCEWKQPITKKSFRKEIHSAILPPKQIKNLNEITCSSAYENAENPVVILQEYLKHPVLWEEALIGLKAIGSGSSPWCRVYHLKTLCG
jgi:replication-associated recombination protein RarA